jgi:Fe-S cluster biogenesis protein NfuA/nitrite reductase/ring-hydroxylating ferredoxin subunit
VLLLYDLHPVDLETRVRGALEKSRPYLKSHGGNVELAAVEDTVVRLRMQGSCSGCPSSAVTLKLAIEQAIYEAAPDVSAILVDGQAEPHPAAAVIAALKAGGNTNGHLDADTLWQDVPDLGRLANGATRRLEVSGREVLFCRLEANLYAYGARCTECDADLGAASLEGRSLACPGCGLTFDVVQAGRAPTRPGSHLDPFPILTRNGRTQVALPPAGVAVGSA